MNKTPTPASHAARLLRDAAEELKQSHTLGGLGEWKDSEPEVKAVYDEHIAVANALETAQPARECLQQSERKALDGLLAVASAAFHCADDSEDDGGDTIKVQPSDMAALGTALDALDELPDDQPGFVMGPVAKAQWALRALQAAPPAPEAVAVQAAPALAVQALDSAFQHLHGGNTSEAMKSVFQARAALAAAPAQASDTESVLIDGVAYEVPAAVAGELLSLHLDLLAAAPAQAVAVPAPEWDGKLPERLQCALNALRLECSPAIVADVEHEVRSHYEALHTSLATVRRMYGAARDRLEALDAAQPDPFAAPAQEHATQLAGQGQDALQEVFKRADQLIDVMDDLDQNAPEHRSYVSGAYEDSLNDLRRAVTAARTAPAQAQEDARDALHHAELREIQRAVEEFADCGETDVDYALLMRAAQAGYLECTHFQVMNESALNLDAARAAQGGAA